MKHCYFYQAELKRSQVWFFVATLRSFEHLCFDRAYDPVNNKFEFFVPRDQHNFFETLMNYYKDNGVVISFCRQDNINIA